MSDVFTVSLREGLEATIILAILCILVQGSERRRLPRLFAPALVVTILACVALTLLLVAVGSSISATGREAVTALFAVIAAGTLTSVVLRSARSTRDARLRASLPEVSTPRSDAAAFAALVPVAVLAVLREGVETSVFVASLDPPVPVAQTLVGVLLATVIAVLVGFAVHRLAFVLDRDRFLFAANAFLIVVAAGLVAVAVRSIHATGWLTLGDAPWFDLSGTIHPSSAVATVVEGLFGIHVAPTTAEVIGWTLYLATVAVLIALISQPLRRRRPVRVP